jgi:hypothetical protein
MTNATTILRLRCVRCGDWHEREAGDPYLPEICGACFTKFLARGTHALLPFVDRYRRGTERHPTMLALKAWWEKYAASMPTAGDGPW